MNPEATFATSADGTSIAFYDFGGSGPDLLIAHASGFCAMVYEPIIRHLTDKFRCVAYDTRGHGLSASPKDAIEGWDWQRFSEDAEAVVATAGLTDPHGFGHSSGGASLVLLEERKSTFASLYLFEPVIFEADPPTGPDPDRELAVRTRRRRATFASRDEALETFSSKGPFVPLDRDALEAYVDYAFAPQADGSITLRCAPEDEAQVYVMASAHDGYTRLSEVKCPTVFAHGETSTSFSEHEVRHLALHTHDATFQEFAGWGHFGPLEHPEEFANTLITTISQ